MSTECEACGDEPCKHFADLLDDTFETQRKLYLERDALRAQVEQLTKERDEARAIASDQKRARISADTKATEACEAAARRNRTIAKLREERDEARAAFSALGAASTREHDDLRALARDLLAALDSMCETFQCETWDGGDYHVLEARAAALGIGGEG